MDGLDAKRQYIKNRVRRALLARKGIIEDPSIIGVPFRGGVEDFIEKSSSTSITKSSDYNLSKLLALSTGLEYLIKWKMPWQQSPKREYLAPGEEAPEGVQVERGQRGGRYYTPGVASSEIDRALADIETPEEEREIDVVAPSEQEVDVSTDEVMLSRSGVNNYFAKVAAKLEDTLGAIRADNEDYYVPHKPFLGEGVSPSDLISENIEAAKYTNGTKEGADEPSGMGIHSRYNFTVTIQNQPFIFKHVTGENRGELLAYSIDRALGFNIVPFTKQYSIDVEALSAHIPKLGEKLDPYSPSSAEIMTESAVGTRAAGHFQEFCGNCVSRDEQPKVMAEMLATSTGREEIFKIMFLDYLTGNSDRHTGNYLITEDGKMVAIDNGMVGGIYAAHQNQASLVYNPSSFGYLSFPYGLAAEMNKKFTEGGQPTKDELINEAETFFDKNFDQDKLDPALASINWKSFFVEGHNARPIDGTPETIEHFKKRFVERAVVNFEDAFNVGWEDVDSWDRRMSFGSSPQGLSLLFAPNLKQDLADEGINIEVIHSLNFDAHDLDEIDLEEPDIYEEDEFN